MAMTADLELVIHRKDKDSYSVDFRFSDGDQNSQADVRLGSRRQATAVFNFLELTGLTLNRKEYGKKLTEALFADELLRTAFAQARATAQQSQSQMRVRIAIDSGAVDLHTLVWETLNDPQTGLPLATDQNIYFSRYLSSLDWRPVRLRSRGEMRALAAVAAPDGLEKYKLAPIDRKCEVDIIQTGLAGVSLRVLERGTLDAITAALTETEFDVLYLVAHGSFLRGDPYLWLEDENGGVQQVAGGDFVDKLQALANRPRLVVLTSCQSAGQGVGDVLASLGPRLAEAGIPAVLAMQDNLRMETGQKLMPIFFSELQKDGRIDRALNVARGQVTGQPDWWVPALFMRLKSGRLWYVPGFGGPQGTFEKWPSLLDVIQYEQCTPIIGPGLLDPIMGSVRDLAQQWAEDLQYPMAAHERESLPQVAQFLTIDQSRVKAEREWMAQMRKAIARRHTLPDNLRGPTAPVDAMLRAVGKRLRDADPYETHRVLAGMPVKIFITANTDELLEDALRDAGKEPTTLVCPWREFSEQTDPAKYKVKNKFNPTVSSPLVYHLFGVLSEPESLVLTEDDTFAFLIGISRHIRNIPAQIGRALTDSALLFLGFQTEEWSFRVVMQALLGKEGRERLRRYAHIAAQIEPEEGRSLNPGRARRYLETYFARGADVEINIFWGTAREFIKELATQIANMPQPA